MKKDGTPRISRGRRAALLAAVGAALSLAAALAASRNLLLAEWCISRLRSPDPAVRRSAIERLGELRSPRATPRLIEIIEEELSGGSGGGSLAGPALASIAATGKKAISDLAEARGSWSAPMRLALIHQFADQPELAARLIPVVAAALQDDDWSHRQSTVYLLEKLSADAEEAVPGLVEALEHPDDFHRMDITRTLAKIGPPAIPQLREAVAASGGAGYRYASACDALRRIGAPAIPALNELLRHPDAPVRRAAVQALYFMEARSAESVPALHPLLADEDPTIRFYAAEAFAGFGRTAATPPRPTP